MATDQQTADKAQQADAGTDPLVSFTAEFREQARKRRFESVRNSIGEPAPEPRARNRRTSRSAAAHPAASAPIAIGRPALADPIPLSGSAYTRAQHAPPAPIDSRLSDDPYSAIVELSRLADRVVESRELAAAERTRADRAERDLRFVNERLMAARALVHEAQRTARSGAERCAYLEGRCETLQGALDQALHMSLMRRWRWRRAFGK